LIRKIIKPCGPRWFDALEGLVKKTGFLSAVAALALLGSYTVGAAQASTLIGDVISGSYAYPCEACTYTGNFTYFTNPFVVDGPPAETALFGGNPVYYWAWDVDFNANSVTLTMATAPLTYASYSAAPFSGPVFTILSGNSFGSITGLVVNNPDCVPCNPITAYLSADASTLFINWEGAGGEVGDTITVDFSVGDPVATPLPPTLPLFASGLGALGLLGWRRKRKNADALAVV
jgi:hypothetical protein